mmetsp:Transcript_48708/g.121647  ORF Transcript_48708/g.121647 Transcript_48708/m.121647 type:complete len:268 (-) Transcript_48708:1611-2414(-)
MRDNEHGAVLELAPDRRLNQTVSVWVHVGCRLVHHNHPCSPQQNPRQEGKLPLPSRNVLAIVSEHHVELQGLRPHHAVQAHLAQAAPHLLVLPLIKGVKERPQCTCTQLSVLGDNRHAVAEIEKAYGSNVYTINSDEALLQFDQSEESSGNGALACTRPSDNPQFRPSLDREAHTAKHGLASASVAHDGTVKLDIPPARPRLWQPLDPWRRLEGGFRCNTLVLVDAFGSNHRVLKVLPVSHPRRQHLLHTQAIRHRQPNQPRRYRRP